MTGAAFLVGLFALIFGIVRARRSEKGSRKRKRSRTLAWVGGIAMLYGVFAAPVPEEPSAEVKPTPEPLGVVDVRDSCQSAIRALLDAPNTATFPGPSSPERTEPMYFSDDKSWSWLTFVHIENASGAPIRIDWSCYVGDSGHAEVSQIR